MDGSLSISACRPPAPVRAQLPSGLRKKPSSLLFAAVLPPIASNRPRALNGTLHVDWAGPPSADPASPAGAGAGEVPVSLRVWVKSRGGVHTVRQERGRGRN